MAGIALGLLSIAPALINGISGMVHAVESLFGHGKGKDKRAAVVEAASAAVTSYDAVAEVIHTKQLDESAVNGAIGELVDAIVKFNNTFGVFTHGGTAQPSSQ